MALYHEIAKMLKERILRGDYALTSFPPVQTLAQELGISYVTAQRAAKVLQDDGLVVRRANGRRLDIASTHESNEQLLQVALLLPTFASPLMEYWRAAIEQVAAQTRAFVPRPVLYTHWHDPLLTQTLDAFDGVFLCPRPSALPDDIRDKLSASRKVVVIDGDLSQYGIPSIQPFPPVFVQRMLDHLEARGHRNIDCLNVQPMDQVCRERIDQWDLWMSAHRFTGQLINNPVEIGTVPNAHAYQVVSEQIEQGRFNATALFCVTIAAAVGASRALCRHGLQVGRDVAVCAMNGESLADWLMPSITTVDHPDAAPYILRSLKWLQQPNQSWIGSLLMEPKEANLQVRESTDFSLAELSVRP